VARPLIKASDLSSQHGLIVSSLNEARAIAPPASSDAKKLRRCDLHLPDGLPI
jgi:hypothetical protein